MNQTAMELLKLTGFHFQPDNKSQSEPYIIFPFTNEDDLLLPCYDAVRAVSELHGCILPVIQSYEELVPTSQDNLSHLIDIVSIPN